MKLYMLVKMFTNPLVWIGVILCCFTLHYEGEKHPYEIFFDPITYRNLFIGSGIYVAIFDIKHKAHSDKIDYKETLMTIIEKMAIILFVWLFSLALYVEYHASGEAYSEILRSRYARALSNK